MTMDEALWQQVKRAYGHMWPLLDGEWQALTEVCSKLAPAAPGGLDEVVRAMIRIIQCERMAQAGRIGV